MDDRKSIFITGAASGIGRATARLFAEKGWLVGIADLNKAGLISLKSEIGQANCQTMLMDVTDPVGVETAMASFADKTGGRMNALFNNAGILKFGQFTDVDLPSHLKIVDVNLKGILTCTHFALPFLKATPGAHLINMASVSAVYGIPDLSVYSASKHAVRALTEAWDIELESYGIVVSDILAPYVRTPLLETPREVQSIKRMGVHLTPDAIANIVWKAVHGKRLHWWVGGMTYGMLGLFWLLPFIKRPVIKMMTY